jgi:hypothetical protein
MWFLLGLSLGLGVGAGYGVALAIRRWLGESSGLNTAVVD